MTGDVSDFLTRIKRVLPPWFGDFSNNPVLTGLLSGFAWLHSYTQLWIVFTGQQIRLATATGEFLDGLAQDFTGDRVLRKKLETDTVFRRRIQSDILRLKVSRPAMVGSLETLTGYKPIIVEPWNVADTGAWNTKPTAWNSSAVWGSLATPHTAFVTAFKPPSRGVSGVGGWNTPQAAWGKSPFVSKDDQDGVTDSDIVNLVNRTKAAGKLIWLRVESYSVAPPSGDALDIDFTLDLSGLDS